MSTPYETSSYSMNIAFIAIEVSVFTLAIGAVYFTAQWAGRAIAWIQQSSGTAEKVKQFNPQRFENDTPPLNFQTRHSEKNITKNNTISPLNSVIVHGKELAKTRKPTTRKPTPSYVSRQTNLSTQPKNEQIEFLKEQYNLINSSTTVFIIPNRRICGFGTMESQQTIARAKKAIFITSEEIIEIHPMSVLPNSPFIKEITEKDKQFYNQYSQDKTIQDSLLASEEKKAQAIAITKSCKHIILQQTVKSCVPSCVAMLLLDRGKKPDYEMIKYSCLSNTEQAIKWINEAQLEWRLSLVPLKNSIDLLSKCLAENGPGMLEIYHPVIAGHVIILDRISTEKNEAVIRDSFHGWMITIKLDALISWLRPGNDFLQII